MPSKPEIWKEIKKFELNKTQNLNYNMTKVVLEQALNDYAEQKLETEKEPEIEDLQGVEGVEEFDEDWSDDVDITDESPEIEIVEAVKEEPVTTEEESAPEPHVPLSEQPEPAPQPPVAVDPEIQDAEKVFAKVAETIAPDNGTTWRQWWTACRKQLRTDPDSAKIQAFMREWVKENYDLTI